MSKQLLDNLNEIKNQKDTYLLPENIKKDVTVLGITGTLESGADTSTTDNGLRLFTSLAEAEANESSLMPGEVAVIFDTIAYPFVLGKHSEPACRGNMYDTIPGIPISSSLFINTSFTLAKSINYSDSVEYKNTVGSKTTTYSIKIDITETECLLTMNYHALASTTYIKYTSSDGLNYIFEKRYTISKGEEVLSDSMVLTYGIGTTIAQNLYDLAADKYDSFKVLNDIFYRKANYGFVGMWFVDVSGTPTSNSIYSMDLARALTPEYSGTGYYYPTKNSIDLTDILPILKSMTYSSTSSSQSTVTVCITDDYYYSGTCLGLIYSKEEDKLYLYGYNNDARSCSRYDRNTGVITALSPSKQIYETGETIPTHIYAELPKTAICVEFDGTFSSSTLTGINSFSTSGPDLYIYNTTQGSNIVNQKRTIIHQYSTKIITKNDFGSPFTTDDLPKYTSAITNNGFIIGTKAIPEISLQEEIQAIDVLNDVIGGGE